MSEIVLIESIEWWLLENVPQSLLNEYPHPPNSVKRLIYYFFVIKNLTGRQIKDLSIKLIMSTHPQLNKSREFGYSSLYVNSPWNMHRASYSDIQDNSGNITHHILTITRPYLNDYEGIYSETIKIEVVSEEYLQFQGEGRGAGWTAKFVNFHQRKPKRNIKFPIKFPGF